ncbi:hypothetical protein C8Q80DRAFT_1196766 [Daedaleopsis nitida]|nr:hypothetical protein C8Q80DRAFT_1196766 [Daedaleopsis nitida]
MRSHRCTRTSLLASLPSHSVPLSTPPAVSAPCKSLLRLILSRSSPPSSALRSPPRRFPPSALLKDLDRPTSFPNGLSPNRLRPIAYDRPKWDICASSPDDHSPSVYDPNTPRPTAKSRLPSALDILPPADYDKGDTVNDLQHPSHSRHDPTTSQHRSTTSIHCSSQPLRLCRHLVAPFRPELNLAAQYEAERLPDDVRRAATCAAVVLGHCTPISARQVAVSRISHPILVRLCANTYPQHALNIPRRTRSVSPRSDEVAKIAFSAISWTPEASTPSRPNDHPPGRANHTFCIRLLCSSRTTRSQARTTKFGNRPRCASKGRPTRIRDTAALGRRGRLLSTRTACTNSLQTLPMRSGPRKMRNTTVARRGRTAPRPNSRTTPRRAPDTHPPVRGTLQVPGTAVPVRLGREKPTKLRRRCALRRPRPADTCLPSRARRRRPREPC